MPDQKKKPSSNNPRKALTQIAVEQMAKGSDAPAGVAAVDAPLAAKAEAGGAGAAVANAGAGAEAAKGGGAVGDAGEAKAAAGAVGAGAAVAASPAAGSPSGASAAIAAATEEKPTTRTGTRKVERKANPEAEERLKKQARKRTFAIVRNVSIIAVVLLVVAAVSGFWAVRWGLYDDAADLQGTWQIAGTTTTVEVTDESFVLTDDIAYDYAVNPEDKTLTFKFGALSGQARYRFSTDRSQLAVQDGEYDWLSTVLADIPWAADALVSVFCGNGDSSPAFDDGIVLERIG